MPTHKYNYDQIRNKFIEWADHRAKQSWDAFRRPSPSTASDPEKIAYIMYQELCAHQPKVAGYEAEYGDTRYLFARLPDECEIIEDADGEILVACDSFETEITKAYVRLKVPGRKSLFIVCVADGVELCRELPRTYHQYHHMNRIMGDLECLAFWPYEDPRLFGFLDRLLERFGWPVRFGDSTAST